MVRSIFRPMALKLMMVTAFFSCLMAVTARGGIDSYEIYLNNKLILKQSVLNSLQLKSLPLDQANINDKLIIYYNHCHAPGKAGSGRSITVKDANGKILKEWKFKDSKGSNNGMEIPVKELIALEKKNPKSGLRIFYASHELPQGQTLASLDAGGRKTT